MGGRAAEEIVYGPERSTTGASSDLSVATEVAEAMVKLYGMSDKVRAPVHVGPSTRACTCACTSIH